MEPPTPNPRVASTRDPQTPDPQVANGRETLSQRETSDNEAFSCDEDQWDLPAIDDTPSEQPSQKATATVIGNQEDQGLWQKASTGQQEKTGTCE